MKGILPYAIAILFGAGCATTGTNIKPAQQIEVKECATMAEAMKVLGVTDPSMIQTNLPDGYKTLAPSIGARLSPHGTLTILAGIYAGTMEIRKTSDGYISMGTYSRSSHPEALKYVLGKADVNGDKVVTPKEISDMEAKVFKEYAK